MLSPQSAGQHPLQVVGTCGGAGLCPARDTIGEGVYMQDWDVLRDIVTMEGVVVSFFSPFKSPDRIGSARAFAEGIGRDGILPF